MANTMSNPVGEGAASGMEPGLMAMKVRTPSDVVERFREALMKAHADDWDMETISEAAHVCAAEMEQAHDGNDLLVIQGASHRPYYYQAAELAERYRRWHDRPVWQFKGEGRPHSENYEGP